MYDQIEGEIKGVQQALYSIRTVSTTSLSSRSIKLGDDPAQIYRLANVTEALIRRVQEKNEQATEALK
jgi:hypothetical protein